MKKFINALKTLKTGTIVRTILQLVVYVNQLLAVLNQSPLGSYEWYKWVSFIFTVLITAYTYWQNNDWSKLAKTASEVFDMVSDGKITEDELEDFISNHKKENDITE